VGNPVLGRELLSLFRSRRMALIQCLLPLGLGLLILLRWPSEGRVALSGSRSQEVFRLFALGLLSAMLLLVPVFPAISIVKEKIRGTLGLLLNTPLGSFKIYFGKLLAILGLAAVVLLSRGGAADLYRAVGGVALPIAQTGLAEQPATVHGRDAVNPTQVGEGQPDRSLRRVGMQGHRLGPAGIAVSPRRHRPRPITETTLSQSRQGARCQAHSVAGRHPRYAT